MQMRGVTRLTDCSGVLTRCLARYLPAPPTNTRYFWFGDSGQGDVAMGESMLEMQPAAVGGVYIHDVFKDNTTTPKSPQHARQAKDELGVHIVDTCVRLQPMGRE
jgi:hypothetical protein